MSITTTTHLNFRGDARAALEFYRSVFGGEIALITFRDAGIPVDPAEADLITWGEVRGDNGFHVMGYDVPSALSYDQGDKPVYVSVRGDADSADEIRSYWDGLAQGAEIEADLGPAPWGAPLYGMLKDRFGVVWVLDVQGAY
ncbi:VOC family protein [Umezawaea sp. Da 62-37]|uniref:VOC family protein n=1 Tax=Umezawaea sp. Da 62-37 TaxID=3075927 RepID=UPI0028F6FDDE|nr:VOC family protein [Umezawaea sp. Da 62-37]WNV85720.1 VOC family protein [Umezawaea sp. Da 62-37]